MNNNNNNNNSANYQQHIGNPGSNQPLDYDTWVNSLGNIQDGVFQNTPMSNHIISNFGFQPQQQQQQQQQIPPLNIPLNHDLSSEMFFNSPERFYRDIINESPVINRTPLGRTPLRSLNINFSTPNFLKSIEIGSSVTKNFTPLKNEIFNQGERLFETPNDKKQSTTLNSSPTTIKMNSSAIKNDENSDPNVSKILPPSPTPASKQQQQQQKKQQQLAQQQMPTIPKMGFFKKNESTPTQQKPSTQQQTKRVNHPSNNKFQIIISDVSTFANSSKNSSKGKKKKLSRSSTVTGNSSKPILTKKTNLKRSASHPHSNSKVLKPSLKEDLLSSNHLMNLSHGSIGHSEITVEDLFDEKILSDTENLNDW